MQSSFSSYSIFTSATGSETITPQFVPGASTIGSRNQDSILVIDSITVNANNIGAVAAASWAMDVGMDGTNVPAVSLTGYIGIGQAATQQFSWNKGLPVTLHSALASATYNSTLNGTHPSTITIGSIAITGALTITLTITGHVEAKSAIAN